MAAPFLVSAVTCTSCTRGCVASMRTVSAPPYPEAPITLTLILFTHGLPRQQHTRHASQLFLHHRRERAFYETAMAGFRSRISTANGAAPMVKNPNRIIVHPNPAISPSQPYSTGAIIPEP